MESRFDDSINMDTMQRTIIAKSTNQPAKRIPSKRRRILINGQNFLGGEKDWQENQNKREENEKYTRVLRGLFPDGSGRMLTWKTTP